MRAAYLIKTGAPETAFEIRDTKKPVPVAGEVLIKVEGFGLNFADVMARLGLYRQAPPVPSVLGYDVAGTIEAVGPGVNDVKVGDRVTALTRFGGYAEYTISNALALAVIPQQMEAGEAVALSTQYCTAYYLAEEMAGIQSGDQVLIHAAAGGVGTALVQLALNRGAIIYGTAGSEEKLNYLQKAGVHYPINYRKHDFSKEIRRTSGFQGLDVVFDPVGGKSVKKGIKLLGAGGRLIAFGASSMTQAGSLLGKIRVAWGFGFYHPVGLLTKSKGLIGVNMLEIADHSPHKIQRIMKQVISMHQQEILRPEVGGIFTVDQLAQAHRFLESRKSMGKIVVKWK